MLEYKLIEITEIKNEKEQNVLILIAKALGKSRLYDLFEKSKIVEEMSQDDIYSLSKCNFEDFFNSHDMQDIDKQNKYFILYFHIIFIIILALIIGIQCSTLILMPYICRNLC